MVKIVSVILLAVFFAACVFLACTIGCTSRPIQAPAVEPNSPATAVRYLDRYVEKTIVKQDWLTTLAVLGIAAAAVGFWTGGKFAMPLFIGSSTILVTLLMLARYAQWLAFIGAALGIGMLIYAIIINKHAVTDLMTGAQDMKDKMLGQATELRKQANEILASAQSPMTTKIVKMLKPTIIPPKE